MKMEKKNIFEFEKQFKVVQHRVSDLEKMKMFYQSDIIELRRVINRILRRIELIEERVKKKYSKFAFDEYTNKITLHNMRINKIEREIEGIKEIWNYIKNEKR